MARVAGAHTGDHPMNYDCDFFFVSYDEPFADAHFELLRARVPAAKRVRGVRGVHQAIYTAARLSSTPRFFALDADGVLDDQFVVRVPGDTVGYSTLIWSANNAAVGLQYGHGGLKLYDAGTLRAAAGVERVPRMREDFKRAFDLPSGKTKRFLPAVANDNLFNLSPMTAWRGAFRECFKLSFERLTYGETEASAKWLEAWCNPVREADNAEWIRRGAADAIEVTRNDPIPWLHLINDFDALREMFWGK